MKVLYVSKCASHFGITHVHEVARRLAARGHDVTVLCAKTRPGQAGLEVVDGVRMHALPTAPSRVRDAGRFGFLAARMPFYVAAPVAVARHYADADAIIEDLTPLHSPLLPRVAASSGTPLIYLTHNLFVDRAAWTTNYGRVGVFGWMWERHLRNNCKCDLFLADGKQTADSYRADLPCPVFWMPNAVDTERFTPAERSNEGPLRVLAVGRLVDLKNQALLIRAAAEVRGDIRLRIVGDGPLRAELASLAQTLGVDARVELAGFRTAEQMVDEYQQADLFVMPSLIEGMPHAALEAMSSGLPVAMSDIDVAQWLVDASFGWILPATDQHAWTSLIDKLAADRSGLLQMGRLARKNAVAWGNWDHATDRMLEYIGQAAVERAERRR